MSSEALAWAFKQDIKPSGLKFTLVAMCECANYQTGRIFASIAHLSEITGQDRKTVIANMSELEARGYIKDTGERTGRTNQVKVYRTANGTVPETEQFQKRNSSENHRKESQKRDTEPSLEPSPSDTSYPQDRRAKKPARKAKTSDAPAIPGWMPAEPWNGYLEMRRRIGKPPTNRAITLMIGKLERWRADGHDPGAILDEATEHNWTGLYPPKEPRNGTHGSQDFQYRNGSGPDRRTALDRAIDEGFARLGR